MLPKISIFTVLAISGLALFTVIYIVVTISIPFLTFTVFVPVGS
jgi:hypothetical protein